MGFGVNSKKKNKNNSGQQNTVNQQNSNQTTQQPSQQQGFNDYDYNGNVQNNNQNYNQNQSYQNQQNFNRNPNQNNADFYPHNNINSMNNNNSEMLGAREKKIKSSSPMKKILIISGIVVGVLIVGGIVLAFTSTSGISNSLKSSLTPTNKVTSKQASLFSPNNSSSSTNSSGGENVMGSNNPSNSNTGGGNTSSTGANNKGVESLKNPGASTFSYQDNNNQTGSPSSASTMETLTNKTVPFNFEVQSVNNGKIAYVQYKKICVETSPGVELLLLKGTWNQRTVYINPPFTVWNDLPESGTVPCTMETVTTEGSGQIATHFTVAKNATQAIENEVQKENQSNEQSY